jgi:CheY-like chemotaxis protein
LIPNAGRNALVVDDAPPVRMLLQTFLGKIGYEVRTATDGDEAIVAFRERRPTIVFMDMEMPRVPGEQAARAMLDEQPDLKVVLMTALDGADERIRALRSYGVHAVLHKPVRLEQVRNILDVIDDEQSNVTRIR